MLSLFKRQYSLFAIVLISVALILLHFLLPYNIDFNIFWKYNFVSPSPFIAKIISFMLVSLQSVLIYFIVSSIRQVEQYSFLYTWLFVFCIHLFPEFYTLSPALIVNTLLLISLLLFYYKYEYHSENYIFYIGFIIGISTLIWIPSIFFLVFFTITLFQYNKLTFKSLNILFFSTLIPVLNYIFIIYLSNKNLPPLNLKFGLNVLHNKIFLNYISSFTLLIFALIGMFNTTILAKKINQSGRLFYNTILSTSIIFFVLLFFNSGSFLNSILILCFPASIYLSLSINIFKRPIISELVHLTILLLTIINSIIYNIDF